MPRELTAEDIRSLGYEVEELQPRIFAIKNFLSKEEIDRIMHVISTYTEEDWRHRYLEEMRAACLEKFGRDDIEELVAEGLLEVTWNFADKNVGFEDHDFKNMLTFRVQDIFDLLGENEFKVNGFHVVHRLYEDSELLAHFDQYSDKLIEYAAILYVNEGYTKGELFFTHFDFEYTPDPGTLMVFPGSERYHHGVRPVGPGPVRYNLPSFVRRVHPDGEMSGWAEFG